MANSDRNSVMRFSATGPPYNAAGSIYPGSRPPFNGPPFPATPSMASYRTAGPPSSAMPSSVAINESSLQSLRVSRTFHENSGLINHTDFSTAGDTLITSADDEAIVIYDCIKGSVHRILNCKKYGVENVIYTHSSTAALHSSSKTDDHIRYLNLQENKYISSFSGHTKKVLHICLSPVDDQFISSSADKSIRLWDHRVGSTGILPNLDTSPIIAFDPEGLVFAAGCCVEREQRIMLYDVRSYSEGPFAVFRYGEEQDADWCGMKISPNGRYLLVSTNGFTVYVMDSFTGVCMYSFKGHANRGVHLEASFTPDSNFVLIGSYDGKVHVWNLHSGSFVAALQGAKQKDPSILVNFSPANALLVTAGSQLSLWLPLLPTN